MRHGDEAIDLQRITLSGIPRDWPREGRHRLMIDSPTRISTRFELPEGWSNKSWPMFQLQDFDLRRVSPMTPRPKSFKKIMEQS